MVGVRQAMLEVATGLQEISCRWKKARDALIRLESLVKSGASIPREQARNSVVQRLRATLSQGSRIARSAVMPPGIHGKACARDQARVARAIILAGYRGRDEYQINQSRGTSEQLLTFKP